MYLKSNVFLFRKGDTLLKYKIDDALRILIKNGTVSRLKEKWWTDDRRCDYESRKSTSWILLFIHSSNHETGVIEMACPKQTPIYWEIENTEAV